MQTSAWEPDLGPGDAPLHAKLSRALARDIGAGVLGPGDRLPTHRDLAYRLRIAIGTVTRAYAEAEERGFIQSFVGRGSFVAGRSDEAAPAPDGPLDLARNLAPLEPAAKRFQEALKQFAKRTDVLAHLDYAPPAGLEAHRRAGVAWLARTANLPPNALSRLLVCAGAQQAISLSMALLCRPGDTLLIEAATFHGMRNLAEQAGYRLRGVAIDGEGLRPDALDKAAKETGAKALYTLPTLQNPTGTTMSLERRDAIVAVCRKHGIAIVEDDIYATFVLPEHPPLAALAPERTFYISGVSKVLGPGLRAGYLVAPDADRFERLVRILRAQSYTSPSLGSQIATQWIEDGTADTIAAEVRVEVAARRTMARTLLGDRVAWQEGAGSHLWMPMSELEAERLAGRALRGGIELTPPSAPIVDPTLISGLRLCIGGAPTRAALERALTIIAHAAGEQSDASSSGVI